MEKIEEERVTWRRLGKRKKNMAEKRRERRQFRLLSGTKWGVKIHQSGSDTWQGQQNKTVQKKEGAK